MLQSNTYVCVFVLVVSSIESIIHSNIGACPHNTLQACMCQGSGGTCRDSYLRGWEYKRPVQPYRYHSITLRRQRIAKQAIDYAWKYDML